MLPLEIEKGNSITKEESLCSSQLWWLKHLFQTSPGQTSLPKAKMSFYWGSDDLVSFFVLGMAAGHLA